MRASVFIRTEQGIRHRKGNDLHNRFIRITGNGYAKLTLECSKPRAGPYKCAALTPLNRAKWVRVCKNRSVSRHAHDFGIMTHESRFATHCGKRKSSGNH